MSKPGHFFDLGVELLHFCGRGPRCWANRVLFAAADFQVDQLGHVPGRTPGLRKNSAFFVEASWWTVHVDASGAAVLGGKCSGNTPSFRQARAGLFRKRRIFRRKKGAAERLVAVLAEDLLPGIARDFARPRGLKKKNPPVQGRGR